MKDPPTGYRDADESKDIDPGFIADWHEYAAAMRDYEKNGGAKSPTLLEFTMRRLKKEGWGDIILRPCPRCVMHWPLMICRCFTCEAEYLFGATQIAMTFDVVTEVLQEGIVQVAPSGHVGEPSCGADEEQERVLLEAATKIISRVDSYGAAGRRTIDGLVNDMCSKSATQYIKWRAYNRLPFDVLSR